MMDVNNPQLPADTGKANRDQQQADDQ